MTDRSLVLVTGPPRAGVTSLVAALRAQAPGLEFVEVLESERVPAAVVVVVSAVAPMTESDCRHVDFALTHTDFVVGVVSKVDVHRGWREVLAANRAAVGRVPWVSVAAAPATGAPRLGELVAWLRAPVPVAPLRRQGSARAEQALALRGGLYRMRSELSRGLRRDCARMRADFRAAELPRGGRPVVEAHVRDAVAALWADLDERMLTSAAELADALGIAALGVEASDVTGLERAGLPELPAPPVASGSAERRLTTVLGAGFGLGVAMAVSRLVGGLGERLAEVAFVVGGLSGLALTLWLVVTRARLQERALLDRWISEVVATVRAHGAELIADGVMAVELGVVAARTQSQGTRSGPQ